MNRQAPGYNAHGEKMRCLERTLFLIEVSIHPAQSITRNNTHKRPSPRNSGVKQQVDANVTLNKTENKIAADTIG